MHTKTDCSDSPSPSRSTWRWWPEGVLGLALLGLVAACWSSRLSDAEAIGATVALLVLAFGVGWLIQRHRRDRHTMDALRDQARAIHTYQSQSLAAVESEVRGALNGITGYAEYISHHATDPMIQFTGTIIHENSLRLLKTADVMLDLIHSRPGEAMSPTVDFSLQSFFQALHLEHAGSLQDKSLTLDYQIDAELPATLHGKGPLVRKVIANLTENAIRFSDPRGQIRLRAGLAQDEKHVHIRIEDDGALVPHASLAAMLEQNDAPLLFSANHPMGDAAVSLAVAHRLALSIGGRVRHTPKMGKGNMFHFFFPFSPPESTA